MKEYGTISATGHTVQKAKKVKAVPMKRGRKTGRRMQEVIEREKKMCEEWDQGVFGKNKSAAAHAHDFDRGNASRIIAKHEKDRKSV